MVRGAHSTTYALALVFSLLGAGCLPDLDGYTIVARGGDGSQPLPTDGGAGTPNPIELGAPCGDPHLLLATRTNTSDDARLLRWDVASNAYCRAAPALERQRAFESEILDVDWHPETRDVLGLTNAVVGLDAQGFVGWRHQPFDDSTFRGSWVVALGSGPSLRVAAFWTERSSSSLEYGRLLDANGFVTNERFEMPFSHSRVVAAHPSGDGRILMASGGPIFAFTIGDGTERLRDADGEDLFPSMSPTFGEMGGTRRHLDTDLATRRVAMTHERGVFLWTLGGPAPTSMFTCPSFCETYSVATPGRDSEVFAICDGTDDHLVRMSAGGGCDLLIDGMGLGSHSLQDVVLVRESR